MLGTSTHDIDRRSPAYPGRDGAGLEQIGRRARRETTTNVGLVEPVATGHAAVSKPIRERVVEDIAPPAAPSAVLSPPAVESPRSNGPSMRHRDAIRPGEQPSTEGTSRESLSPVASEFAALAPDPTETPAVEKPKKASAKRAVRTHVQARNPLELALRPFSGLRLPF
jgi:hypothetical protein